MRGGWGLRGEAGELLLDPQRLDVLQLRREGLEVGEKVLVLEEELLHPRL